MSFLPKSDGQPRPHRILIVEDEETLALIQRRTLEKAGFEAETVPTVDQALERLETPGIDLVLLDYMLPARRGDELVESLGERLAHLPVIMITGYSDVRLAVDMLKAGVADYVVKDTDLQFVRQLPKTVGDAIELYELRQRSRELADRLAASERRCRELTEGKGAGVFDPAISDPAFETQCRAAVEALHHFFQQWFNAEIPNGAAELARFRDVLADDFQYIGPEGFLIEKAQIFGSGTWPGHGWWKEDGADGGRTRVERFAFRRLSAETAVVTFEYWQDFGEIRRGRQDSATFRLDADRPHGVAWLLVQETWLPGTRRP